MGIAGVDPGSVAVVREGPGPVSIVREAGDPVASAPPVTWAIGQLSAALEARGARVEPPGDAEGASDPGGSHRIRSAPRAGSARADARFLILVAGSRSVAAWNALAGTTIPTPDEPESFCLVPAGHDGHGGRAAPGGREIPPDLLAAAPDARGLCYALLELADRVEHAAEPVAGLRLEQAISQQPANEVRSVARLFTSEPHDLPWYRDEGFWRRYLSMLVAQRFNRFSLTLGMGYNFPSHITDSYFYFAYPFLVDVPGYRVHAQGVPDEERQRNLAMLRFASSEAVARGLDFQLALWNHAFAWFDSPGANHAVEGLDPDRHAAYCRDALQAVLKECPGIGGVTLRVHGESGIPERSWDFWSTVFDGIVRSGRHVGIDLHAKGLDRRLLEIALETGLPVTVSPKWAGEHLALPYHQAALRELDRVPVDEAALGTGKGRFMTVSEGSRPFTRYSYGDFLTEDRRHSMVFRIWPGTQRLLLSGDPAMAAAIGRHAGLAGSQGVEWCEPLSFRGREGAPGDGRRDGYADTSLSKGDDWEKYALAYRLLGRLSYDPAAAPDEWRRSQRPAHGAAAAAAEAGLASASRILPLVTSAHHPSASNNYYWPEMYTDIAVAPEGGVATTHYYDTPEPKRFGTVGPLDPAIFSGAAEAVAEALAGEPSGRYTPLHVAGWLERLAGEAAAQLERMEPGLSGSAGAEAGLLGPATAEARRLIVDVGIQEAIGRFFTGKLRAAVYYELFLRTGSRPAIIAAARHCRTARSAWSDAAERASGVYVEDLAFGPEPWLRGTWSDRLLVIEADLATLERLAQGPAQLASGLDQDRPGRDRPDEESDRELYLERVIRLLTNRPGDIAITHRPPDGFRRGDVISLELVAGGAGGVTSADITGVAIRYRRLDQSDAYRQAEMDADGPEGRWTAQIPASYADSAYPIQYFFVLRDRGGNGWIHPGLGEDLCGQPYFVIRSGSGRRD